MCLRIYIVKTYISIVISIVVMNTGINTFNSFKKSIVICRNLMYDIVKYLFVTYILSLQQRSEFVFGNVIKMAVGAKKVRLFTGRGWQKSRG